MVGGIFLLWLFGYHFSVAVQVGFIACFGMATETGIIMLVYLGMLALTYLGFTTVPTGFIPDQDKGYLVVNAQLPDGASLERTEEVMKRVTDIARNTPGVAHALSLPEDAPIGLFALGRSVGWIAHIIEQYQADELIRPRARYTGPLPGVSTQ